MTIPPVLALPLVCLMAVLAVRRTFAAVRAKQVMWGSQAPLVINRREQPAAFWLSVVVMAFFALAFSAVAMHLARSLLSSA